MQNCQDNRLINRNIKKLHIDKKGVFNLIKTEQEGQNSPTMLHCLINKWILLGINEFYLVSKEILGHMKFQRPYDFIEKSSLALKESLIFFTMPK